MERIRGVVHFLEQIKADPKMLPAERKLIAEAIEMLEQYRIHLGMVQQPRIPINGTRGGK